MDIAKVLDFKQSNKFCLQASLNQPITIWKTAFNQKRPYLGLDDLSNAITHIIKKNIFNNQIYNIVSNNYKVSDIVKYIKLFKKLKLNMYTTQ